MEGMRGTERQKARTAVGEGLQRPRRFIKCSLCLLERKQPEQGIWPQTWTDQKLASHAETQGYSGPENQCLTGVRKRVMKTRCWVDRDERGRTHGIWWLTAYAGEKSKSESTPADWLEVVGQAEKACGQGQESDQSWGFQKMTDRLREREFSGKK